MHCTRLVHCTRHRYTPRPNHTTHCALGAFHCPLPHAHKPCMGTTTSFARAMPSLNTLLLQKEIHGEATTHTTPRSKRRPHARFSPPMGRSCFTNTPWKHSQALKAPPVRQLCTRGKLGEPQYNTAVRAQLECPRELQTRQVGPGRRTQPDLRATKLPTRKKPQLGTEHVHTDDRIVDAAAAAVLLARKLQQ